MKKISYWDIVKIGVGTILISGTLCLGYYVLKKQGIEFAMIIVAIISLPMYWSQYTDIINLKLGAKK